MNPRRLFRSLALAAITADARLSILSQISAWAGNIDENALPVIGVVTPQERIQPEAFEDFERSTLLQVVIKRLGGDELEDTLDDDSDAVEVAICSALMAEKYRCVPEEVTVVLNGDGSRRIGTLMCSFRVTWFRALDGTS